MSPDLSGRVSQPFGPAICTISSPALRPLNYTVGLSPSHGADRGPSQPVLVLFLCCCCSVASVVSDPVRPHRRRPARLPRPWDSPGKSTGVGCHFLLQCMKVKSASEVAQSCQTPSDLMDCSPSGSSIHEIFQARVLESGAIAFSICFSR